MSNANSMRRSRHWPTRRGGRFSPGLRRARRRSPNWRTVRDDSAGHLQAPQGAGARRSDLARSRRPATAVPARSEASCRGQRMAGELPPVLGGLVRPSRRAARRTESTTTHTQKENTDVEHRNSESHDTVRSRDRLDPSLRRTTTTRVRCTEQARATEALVRPARPFIGGLRRRFHVSAARGAL